MDIMQFGTKSTLIQFRGRHYVYQGAAKGEELLDEDVALAIGAYESAFLADIVASYVFEETEECFEQCVFRGIYRDDGLMILVGNRNKSEIQEWLQKYQSLVNELADSDYLQFTTKLWQPPQVNAEDSPTKKDKKEMGVTVIYKKEFLLLDMRMNWDRESGEMRFLVFRKTNQALKYVDRKSTHRPTTFKSFASGVFTRLARLTSKIAANEKASIDKIYPDRAEALFTANLAPPTDFPTFH
eukprot:12987639-Ditylum_brightwellii.AAC.1